MPIEYSFKAMVCPFADLSNPYPTSDAGIWLQGEGHKILCKFQTKEKFLISHCKFFIFPLVKENVSLVIRGK
jgi:hypothetical protein